MSHALEFKWRDERIVTLKARVKELEGELAGWQQNYADQMRNPKQRQAYLAQLEKHKESDSLPDDSHISDPEPIF